MNRRDICGWKASWALNRVLKQPSGRIVGSAAIIFGVLTRIEERKSALSFGIESARQNFLPRLDILFAARIHFSRFFPSPNCLRNKNHTGAAVNCSLYPDYLYRASVSLDHGTIRYEQGLAALAPVGDLFANSQLCLETRYDIA